MLDDFQNGRHEFQLLARLAADSLSRLTAARTGLVDVSQVVVHKFAGQVIGKWSTTAASTNVLTDDQRCGIFGKWGRGCGRVIRVASVKHRQLVGINSFTARTVTTAKQLFDKVLRLRQIALQLIDRRLLL
ncbi:hypothetical protein I41_28490 [Lacipirellula limnantheis]|uniref:Uncharacterized protein n=1 Tax=Lacipirellula limnantheis TaxID=2528024 RepID=A0A517TZ55_9BACT|nr:hypothetical protein I41_28490 [Lacipirellula limnantheis]